MTLDDFHFASILVSTVRNAPVLIFAAMAGLFAERSGVIDIGLEGKILASAFTSAAVAYSTQNPWYGMAAGMLVCVLLALLQGYVSITQKGNQLVAGIAINIAMSGLTFVLAQFFFQQGGRTPDLGDARLFDVVLPGAHYLHGVPFLGWFYGHLIGGHSVLVYLAFLLVPLVHWLLYHSRFGLRLRACGENPHAADAAGISVERQRYIAMLVAGVLCSFSGAYLAIVQSGFFLRDMSAGAGYLALTAMVFGNWRPFHTFLGCLMFGFFSAIQIQIEGVDLPVIGRIPGSLIQMVPYVVTVIVLAGLMAKSVAPKSLGTPFIKSR
ncbi:ABC transporter permease [Janthinobacterium agaricidamnosum]|uniref:Branched-chain amino acid transport system / permease component family protein n=1 Tax=Janthinobacterium agaricidamnosum NBRC 102515 = DSM 9628 TaxID=1349767 RepID=W0VCE7_9BURK|nr:ABC transporter permease [Janthinobacterium agaricidamnosum]CDG85033.1 branched-chain amino acid transport system / permease component family protein [Janthinobacterium agaricidamnosum NBRC 102515 = DSM 9628]